MTPDEKEEKKAAMLAKLQEPAKPVITQVVRVEPSKPKKAESKQETEHFNVNLPSSLAKKVRLHKIETKMTHDSIIVEAVREYFDKRK